MSESKNIIQTETMSEVSQKSNVKVVSYVRRKTWSSGKTNFKKMRTSRLKNQKFLIAEAKNKEPFTKLPWTKKANVITKVKLNIESLQKQEIFVQIPFSIYFKIWVKNCTPQNRTLLHSFSFCCLIITSIWLQKLTLWKFFKKTARRRLTVTTNSGPILSLVT